MKKLLKFVQWLVLYALVSFIIAFFVLPFPGHNPVLMYHFVGTAEDAEQSKNFVTEESFAKQMKFLKRFGYRVISLDELYANRKGTRKPGWREIAITFDDGNHTFGSRAHPIIDLYGFPTTVFFVSESVKQQLHGSLSRDEIKALLASEWLTVGAHTKTHPFLTKMNDKLTRDELTASKADLERMFEVPVDYFAYPYGDFDARVMKMTEEAGYKLAFTTSPKKLKALPITDFSITRVKVTRSADNPIVFWAKVSGIYDFFKVFRHNLKT